MTPNVLPPSCVVNRLTFSSRNALGFFASRIASILKNNVPLVSAKPSPLPAMLKG